MKIDKSKWSIISRPKEANPATHYTNFFIEPQQFKPLKEDNSATVNVSCYEATEIPEWATHVISDYDIAYDDAISLILKFIKYAPLVEIPNYCERLVQHEQNKAEAKKKANEVLDQWMEWCREQSKAEEYQQYLKLQAKYGK